MTVRPTSPPPTLTPHPPLAPPRPLLQLVDFAHARTAHARVGCRPTLVGPAATSILHPDTAGSDLYERFESLVRDASRRASGVPVPPPAKSIEVSAQFDARAHAGDQRGRRGAPVFVDASAPPRTGPLRTLFLEYAKRDGAFGVERDPADVNADLLSRAEAASMAEDFGVVPALVSPRDAASAFRAADRPAAGAEAAVNREGQLDFREFVGYIVNLAILAFHRPPSDAPSGSSDPVAPPPREATDDLVAVDETLRLFECAAIDTRRLRARIAANARAAAHNARDVNRRYPDDSKTAKTRARTAAASRAHPEAARRVASGEVRADLRLIAHATRRDDADVDAPRWTEFAAPALDCGTIHPGEARRFRVRVTNRNLSGAVRVDARCVGCPCVDARFVEGPLAPGLTRIIEIVAASDVAGEWLGAVVVVATPLAGRVLEKAMFVGERRGGARGDGGEDVGEDVVVAIGADDDEGEDAGDAAVDESARLFGATTRRPTAPTRAARGRHEVVVPLYLNVVDRARAVAARAGRTQGIAAYVAPSRNGEDDRRRGDRRRGVADSRSDATSKSAAAPPEVTMAFRAQPRGDAKAAAAALETPGARALLARGKARGGADVPVPDGLRPAREVSDARVAAERRSMSATVRATVGVEDVARFRLSTRGLRY
jgi:hypothetical protein